MSNIDFGRKVTVAQKSAASVEHEQAIVRARRDAAIAAGITVNGIPVWTDETSQTRVAGAALAALIDPSYTVNWKAADGSFVALDASQITAVASAVRAHVQACFDRESDILAAINAGGAYDIEAGWP